MSMKPLLAVLFLAVAAPIGADVVTIECRAADGTLAPCARKLTGGALGQHELISTSTPRHAEGALYDLRPDSRGYDYGYAHPGYGPGYGYGGGRGFVQGFGNGRPHFGPSPHFSGGRATHSRGRGR